MAKIPARVEARFKDMLKRFQPVIELAKARDIGEADTSTLVKDVLADLFGYDKYTEVTAEYQIKGTYCDLAIKIQNELTLLIEVKAINSDLKEAYVKQAVDYGANQGIEWVILTNAQTWQIYKITFAQPISSDLLMTIDLSKASLKNEQDSNALFLLSREAHGKSLLNDFHLQRQALSKFCLGALLISEPVVAVIRRELKRLSPDVKIESEDIVSVLSNEVIKREVIEGDKALEAKRRIAKSAGKALRAKTVNSEVDSPPASPTSSEPIAPSKDV